MKVAFKEAALSELYETGKTSTSKYKQLCRNKKLVSGYQRAVKIMYDVDCSEDLKAFSFFTLREA